MDEGDDLLLGRGFGRRVAVAFAAQDAHKARAQNVDERLEAGHRVGVEQFEDPRVGDRNAQEMARRDPISVQTPRHATSVAPPVSRHIGSCAERSAKVPGRVLWRVEDPHDPLDEDRGQGLGEEQDALHDRREARQAVEAERDATAQIGLLRDLHAGACGVCVRVCGQ